LPGVRDPVALTEGTRSRMPSGSLQLSDCLWHNGRRCILMIADVNLEAKSDFKVQNGLRKKKKKEKGKENR